jgi:hypothetical protein
MEEVMKRQTSNTEVMARRAGKFMLGAAAVLTMSMLQTPAHAQVQRFTSFNDSVGEHAVFIGMDEHVHQTFCGPPQPCNNGTSWNNNQDLTQMAGGPTAGMYTTLASYADSSGEHVFFTDAQYNLYLFSSPTGFSWSIKSLGVKNVGGMSGYSTSAFEYQFYETTDQHIHMLQSGNGGASWVDADLTASSGGALAMYGTNTTSFRDANGDDHVFYQGANQHIYQISSSWQERQEWYEVCNFGSCRWYSYYINVELWANLDLTAQSHGPLAGDSLTSLSDASGEYVFYIGNDGHIHGLQNGSAGWTDQDVTISTRSILPYSGLTSLSNPLGRQLFFIGTDLNVHRLLVGGTGSDQDWTTLAGGQVLNPCYGMTLTSFVNSTGPNETESHVFYVANDGSVHELYELGIFLLARPPLPSFWSPRLQPDLNVIPYSFDVHAVNLCIQ